MGPAFAVDFPMLADLRETHQFRCLPRAIKPLKFGENLSVVLSRESLQTFFSRILNHRCYVAWPGLGTGP